LKGVTSAVNDPRKFVLAAMARSLTLLSSLYPACRKLPGQGPAGKSK
jgi:hypothetical protein